VPTTRRNISLCADLLASAARPCHHSHQHVAHAIRQDSLSRFTDSPRHPLHPYKAMAELPASESRQESTSYSTTPPSYPSPTTQQQRAFAYPPPESQTKSEYQEAPTGSNMPLPPMNLPPIRSIDGQSRQPAAQGPGDYAGPPPLAPMSAHYPPHTQQYAPYPMGITSSSPHAMRMQRYPLPPGVGVDGKIMSGGRHKKEIKRRTKTGCLTCRKRRIKVRGSFFAAITFQ